MKRQKENKQASTKASTTPAQPQVQNYKRHWYTAWLVKHSVKKEGTQITATSNVQAFQSINKQAYGIAYAYKLIGLYSIVMLTVVTIISMTNVFTSGQFATWDWVKNTWALIFAGTIDVNIVRMFVESYIEHRQGHIGSSKFALSIGIGLGAVTGAALLLEGLQQSIGLQWSDPTVHFIVGTLIAFRVVFVVILMAREGRKLGELVYDSLDTPKVLAAQPAIVAVTEATEVTIEDTSVQPQLPQSTVQPQLPQPVQQVIPVTPIQVPDKLELTIEAMEKNPDITDEELAEVLSLKRPASARFWKLQASSLLSKQQPTEQIAQHVQPVEKVEQTTTNDTTVVDMPGYTQLEVNTEPRIEVVSTPEPVVSSNGHNGHNGQLPVYRRRIK